MGCSHQLGHQTFVLGLLLVTQGPYGGRGTCQGMFPSMFMRLCVVLARHEYWRKAVYLVQQAVRASLSLSLLVRDAESTI
jgi:hypothetical protein